MESYIVTKKSKAGKVRPTRDEYAATLRVVLKLLERGRVTVGDVVRVTGCTKPTAKSRILAALALAREAGRRVLHEKVREGERGPASDAYSVLR